MTRKLERIAKVNGSKPPKGFDEILKKNGKTYSGRDFYVGMYIWTRIFSRTTGTIVTREGIVHEVNHLFQNYGRQENSRGITMRLDDNYMKSMGRLINHFSYRYKDIMRAFVKKRDLK